METFSRKLHELSELAAEASKSYHRYNKDDIVNASIIFFEVISSMSYDYHGGKVTKEQAKLIIKEASKSIAQTVKVFTGVDIEAE